VLRIEDQFDDDCCAHCGAFMEGLSNYCHLCGAMNGYMPDGATGPMSRAGLWRQGDLLVKHKDAVLPARCVKTNLPVERFVLCQFTANQSPLFVLLMLLLCVFGGAVGLIVLIVLYFTQKRMNVSIPLSSYVLTAYRRGTLSGVTVVAGSCAFFALAKLMEGVPEILILFIALGALGVLTGMVNLYLYGSYLRVKKIVKDCIFLKGVCPEFLSELPEVY